MELNEKDENSAKINFEVKDSGIGISKEELARLFKPFTQADASTTRRFGGTGLGLAISKELVSMMNGEIAVANEPGQGSKFFFTVSFNLSSSGTGATSKAIADEKPVAKNGSRLSEEVVNPKILLAEDSEMNRNLVSIMLRNAGLSCDFAFDGSEAFDKFMGNSYDIIFMDCQMPIMDGYESTEKIRAFENNEKHTTIIAMTANAMVGDKEKCLEARMDNYISKPINPDTLFKMIEQYTGYVNA